MHKNVCESRGSRAVLISLDILHTKHTLVTEKRYIPVDISVLGFLYRDMIQSVGLRTNKKMNDVPIEVPSIYSCLNLHFSYFYLIFHLYRFAIPCIVYPSMMVVQFALFYFILFYILFLFAAFEWFVPEYEMWSMKKKHENAT